MGHRGKPTTIILLDGQMNRMTPKLIVISIDQGITLPSLQEFFFLAL